MNARVAQRKSGGTSDPRRRGFESLRALQECLLAAWDILRDGDDPEYRNAFVVNCAIALVSAALVSGVLLSAVLLL